MNPLVFAIGALLIVLATAEPLWTTLWVDGHAGPITRRYGSFVRRVTMRAFPRGNHRLLSLSGPLVLVANVLLWALLLWAGWVVLFSADPRSLLHTRTDVPAGLVDRVYFTGYSLFTLGNGDFSPQGRIWEIATALAGLNGLFVLTLSVTYLLALIEAVVAKRAFASQVWALGHTAEELLVHAWDGSGFRSVELQLVSLTQQLSAVTEQHQAYPMLHYYHASRLPQSVAVALAILDDALTMWWFAVSADARPAPAVLHGARATVREFLETLLDAYIHRATETPPALVVDGLRSAGIPLASADPIPTDDGELAERRQLIYGFLQGEHRVWPGGDRP